MTLSDEQFERLEKTVAVALNALGIPFQTSDLDTRYVRSRSFQRPTASGRRGRVYCYCMYEGREYRGNPVDLVFRFRSGAQPNGWFARRAGDPLRRNWAQRMHRIWAQEQNTPHNMLEAGRATDQFGLALSEKDLSAQEFEGTMRTFLEIAQVSVRLASQRQPSPGDLAQFEELVQ